MFGAHRKDAHVCPASELALLQEVAERTWAAAERARAEATLRESEERLRLSPVEDGCWYLGLESAHGQTHLDTSARGPLGARDGSVKCYADFRDRVHPDDIEAVEAGRDAAVRQPRDV